MSIFEQLDAELAAKQAKYAELVEEEQRLALELKSRADAARHLAELVLAATPTPAQPADPLPPDLDAAHAEIRRLRFQLAHANNLIAVICDPAFEEAQP